MDLKSMREKSGLKQSELAKLSGINLRSLQDYEQGHKSVLSAKGETLMRLSLALGYTVEEILSGSPLFIDKNIDNTEQIKKRLEIRLENYEKLIVARREREVHFPIIESDDKVDMSRIYPTKQAFVKRVLTALRPDDRIETLRLFGSSITMACHKESDVDFAVGLKDTSVESRNDISEKIQLACDWGADIIWIDHLSAEDRIFHSISKGLILI